VRRSAADRQGNQTTELLDINQATISAAASDCQQVSAFELFSSAANAPLITRLIDKIIARKRAAIGPNVTFQREFSNPVLCRHIIAMLITLQRRFNEYHSNAPKRLSDGGRGGSDNVRPMPPVFDETGPSGVFVTQGDARVDRSDGLAIPRERQQPIFECFSKFKVGRRGVGLSICQWKSHMHMAGKIR